MTLDELLDSIDLPEGYEMDHISVLMPPDETPKKEVSTPPTTA